MVNVVFDLAAIQKFKNYLLKNRSVMLKFTFVWLVYLIISTFPCIAQSTDSINSKKVVTNHGLIFEKEYEYRLQDSSYMDVIQLLNLGDKAHAMQFRLFINKAADDSAIIIFESIQKGSDLSDPSWLLDFNVKKGQVAPNGASQDEIYIVLYNLNQNGGLLPGDYNNLFTINYRLAKLPGLQKDIKSSIKISHAEASTFQGNAIDIKPSRDELKIYIKKM
jgi:hypothetical protein